MLGSANLPFDPSPLTGERGSGSDTFVRRGEGLGLTGRVVDVEADDVETAGPEEGWDVSVQVAAAGDPLLETVEAVLPSAYAGFGGGAMLDEVKRPTRPQDTPDLTKGRDSVGDRAHGPGAQDRVG